MHHVDVDEFARGLPKAELHVHIEGTLEPEMMFALAARNAIDLPFPDVDAVRAAYSFSDLQSFLDLYYRGAAVLQTERDFADLAAAYLRKAVADNVRRIEMFFDPQTHTKRGIPFDVVLGGLKLGIDEVVTTERSLSVELIMCFLRHLSEADAFTTLEMAMPHRGSILGVGLDSSEAGHPPSKFAKVYAAAAAAGFHLTAHAGEEGSPEYVWEALDILGVSRIDHGVRSLEDTTLVARLVEEQIPLTVCPLSNRKLQVTPDLARHPLPAMIDAGLLVSINSDDPSYFGGYVGDNYAIAVSEMGLALGTLAQVAAGSFRSSFLDDEAIAVHIGEIETFTAQHAASRA